MVWARDLRVSIERPRSVFEKYIRGLSHLAQNKSRLQKERQSFTKNTVFILFNVEIRRRIGGFPRFMWLFRRDLALWRTLVHLRETKSRLLNLIETALFFEEFLRTGHIFRTLTI